MESPTFAVNSTACQDMMPLSELDGLMPANLADAIELGSFSSVRKADTK